MIETKIRAILANDEAVAAIVADRIWGGIKRQNERGPSIVYSLIADIDQPTMEAAGDWQTGIVQIDCFAATYAAVKELAAAVRAALAAAEDAEIGYIDLDNINDIPAEPLEGDAVPLFGVTFDAAFMRTST